MFKKSIIAMTVFGMSSVALGAVSITDNTKTPTPERVTSDVAYASGIIEATVNANYAAGDTIAVTFSHDVDATQVFATAAVDSSSCTTGGDAMSITYAGYSAATKTATYTVNSATAGTLGCKLPIPAVLFDGAAIAAADIMTASIATSKGYGTLETTPAATPYKLFNVAATQFSVTAAAFDGVVDVNKARYELTTATATQVVAVELVDGFVDAGLDAFLNNTSTITLSGDFAWAKSTSDAGVVTYPGIKVETGAASDAAGNDLTPTVLNDTTVTWVAAAAGVYTVSLVPQVKALKIVLPKTTYSYSSNIVYKRLTADTALLSNTVATAGGSWKLNGASITAYGIPNQAAVTPFLWVQNKGASAGDISVDVTCDGASISGIAAGTAAALANTTIGAAVQAGVDAAGTCGVGSRYDAIVTVNGPAADMTLNAGYRVQAADGSNDRLSLETSDSLDGLNHGL